MWILCPLTILSIILLETEGTYRTSSEGCNVIICESMPSNLTYENTAPIHVPIWKIWENMITKSNKSLQIGSFYWTLLNSDVDNRTYFPTSNHGEMILKMLIEKSKIIPVLIVQNGIEMTQDLNLLSKNPLVKINFINFKKFNISGVQHSKFWIADNKTAYIGSANMDWRSLTEIKELGVFIDNCNDLVLDITRFWQALEMISGPSGQIPSQWPSFLIPKYNHTNPLITNLNGVPSRVYTATSPPLFNPPYRTDDLSAIIRTIQLAKSFIHISVMDMAPMKISYDGSPNTFWPTIEDLLKKAAFERNITVRLLISKWPYSNKTMFVFLQSLDLLSRIKNMKLYVKLLIIPAFNEYQRQIPYSRVSHSKYMVTDNTAYIGTSNWSGEYFSTCGGISFIAEELIPNSTNKLSVRSSLNDIFLTDWYSIYAHDIN